MLNRFWLIKDFQFGAGHLKKTTTIQYSVKSEISQASRLHFLEWWCLRAFMLVDADLIVAKQSVIDLSLNETTYCIRKFLSEFFLDLIP